MARILIATANFTASNGTPLTSLTPAFALKQGDYEGEVQSNVAAAAFTSAGATVVDMYNGTGTFTDPQYALATIGGLAFNGAGYRVGVALQIAGSGGSLQSYLYYVQDDSATTPNAVLAEIVSGSTTTLDTTASAWANGDTIALELDGGQLIRYRNGSTVGSPITPTALTGGKPGLVLKGSSGSVIISAWSAGNMGSAAQLSGRSGTTIANLATVNGTAKASVLTINGLTIA